MEIKECDVFCSVATKEIKTVIEWLIPSLEKQKNVKKINLFLINYTGKNRIYAGPNESGMVNIEEINSGKELGFGEAHNFAFNEIKPKKYFLIINPDVYLHEDCICEMVEKIKSDEKIGIVEARQLPFEHPKEYDRVTGETPWASGFGILVKSEFFEKVGGFDEDFWMYCEDVDLSWRAWLDEYSVVCCNSAIGYHYTGNYFEYRNDRYYLEHFWSSRNFLYLAYKYFGNSGFDSAKKYLSDTSYPDNFKKEVLSAFNEMDKKQATLFFAKNKNKITELNKKIKINGFNQYHDLMR
ncbi:MAG: glycosyltransferase [Parcubacteria group bacterium]|jgi:GT2 family glycosyltransferase